MDLKEVGGKYALRHPWETSRCRFFSRLIRQNSDDDSEIEILDLGAGDGFFAGELIRDFNQIRGITCVDPGYAQNRPESENPKLRFHEQPGSGKYDWILLLDVLEHMKDDQAFLEDVVNQNLKEGGKILISVPAWNVLFSNHDRFLGHWRRYSPGHAELLIHSAGLHIDQKGGLFHGLLAPRVISRIWEWIRRSPVRATKHVGEWNHGKSVTRLVEGALWMDQLISRWSSCIGLEIPGLSWWAVCRK